jgi:hypothetical protein
MWVQYDDRKTVGLFTIYSGPSTLTSPSFCPSPSLLPGGVIDIFSAGFLGQILGPLTDSTFGLDLQLPAGLPTKLFQFQIPRKGKAKPDIIKNVATP